MMSFRPLLGVFISNREDGYYRTVAVGFRPLLGVFISNH